MEKVIFTEPIEFEGKTYTEIELNVDFLTGRDMINAVNEARAMGDTSQVPELSKIYQAVLASKAAKVPADMIVALPAKYFSKVTLTVANFLLDQG